jgi:hypothetical protein
MKGVAIALASMLTGVMGSMGPMTARAEDAALGSAACSAWTAQEEEDEGGPVFMASICSTDDPQAFLSVTCFEGTFYLRANLIGPDDESPLDDVATVSFDVDGASLPLQMQYEDMDGAHASELPSGSPLIAKLKAGTRLTISDGAGRYPARRYVLAGSARALTVLAEHCG